MLKRLVISMLIVPAICAVAAASASAASFDLGSGSTAEFAQEPTVTENLVLSAKGEPEIECSKVQLEHGIVTNGSPTVKIESIHFDGCTDESESACKVGTVETKPIKDTLEETTGKGDTIEKFTPSTGKEFANFKLTGESCKTTEELKLDGDFVSRKEDNEESEDTHKVGFSVTSESDELEYGDQLVFAAFRVGLNWGFVSIIPWGLL
jgi:hypothetical protein